ncbi:MAG: DUF4328 domain-containing protein [Chloroflexi bacterium]|nr:DUF4328 domain-containing protein [Chloroflexota bacterium]
MTAAGPWVCGNCRSLNRDDASRCYSCRSPRAMAVDPRATEQRREPQTADTPPAVKAKTARELGSRYRSSAGFAVVAQVAVLVITAITLARTVLVIWLFRDLQDSIADPSTFDSGAALDQAVTVGILHYVMLAAWVAGLVAWGAWLARVVANIPALGGGWPTETPRFAFISTLIPGGNLYWTTSTMRQTITALSAAGAARLGIITAWWLTLTPGIILLLNIGPFRWLRALIELAISILLLLATGGDVRSLLDASIGLELLAGVLIVAAAVLAVLLIQHIERLEAERLTALGPTSVGSTAG